MASEAVRAQGCGPPGPAILIDVDGVLNPFVRCSPPYCSCHRRWRRYRVHPHGDPTRIVLNPAHGRLLRTLATDTGGELVWSTMWQDEANPWVGRRLGLPDLSWVPIPPLEAAVELPPPTIGVWKARHVAEWAAGRPFVWFDDEADVPGELARVDGPHPLGRHLVVPVDGRIGLTEEHVTVARDWLTAAT